MLALTGQPGSRLPPERPMLVPFLLSFTFFTVISKWTIVLFGTFWFFHNLQLKQKLGFNKQLFVRFLFVNHEQFVVGTKRDFNKGPRASLE